jgi:hypothetical protein
MTRWLSGAFLLWAATQANASDQLLCRFPSTEDGTLFETLKIDVTEDEEISVLHVWEPTAGQREHAEREKVVYHHVVRLAGLYTVIATEKPGPRPSTVYYLYWGAVQLAELTREPPHTRFWDCVSAEILDRRREREKIEPENPLVPTVPR